MRMIEVLLADTQLQVRLGSATSPYFTTTIGTPQGDCLSPVLFVVYLEAALRDIRSKTPRDIASDSLLPYDVEYADDVDFVSTSEEWLKSLERTLPETLGNWSLTVNLTKTEAAKATGYSCIQIAMATMEEEVTCEREA